MSKNLSLVVTIVAAVAAGLAALPYSWARPVASGLAAAVAVLHGTYYGVRVKNNVKERRADRGRVKGSGM